MASKKERVEKISEELGKNIDAKNLNPGSASSLLTDED